VIGLVAILLHWLGLAWLYSFIGLDGGGDVVLTGC